MTPTVPRITHAIHTSHLIKVTSGFALIYLVLDGLATWTGSLYGEYGAAICAAVIATALLVERWLFGRPVPQALHALGFGRPTGRGLIAAGLVGLALLLYLPIVVAATGQGLQLRDGWIVIALGVFLQGGIAEEVLWRGYLFRHLRATRSFWWAAALAMVFMSAQHTLLLWSLPFAVAVAACGVALATSFPLAHLFEGSGNTFWGATIVHWVIQGTLKVVVFPETISMPVVLGWMVVCMVVPYLALLVLRRPAVEHTQQAR